jgi:hypothetical protein
MSYQVKKTVVSILTGALLLAAYCIYAFGKVRANTASPDDLKFWASTILIFIGIGIAASIVIQIVFHILLSISIAVKKQISEGRCDEKDVGKSVELEMVEDEMDKLISLKSMRVGFAVAGIGFVAALVSLVLNYSAAVMINILFISFSAGTIIEGVTQLVFYKRGIQNGR